ncbi:hypothetical protein DICSQDRAFT_171367 [Dichomitus squalens LYAD-421 SS1]|uniref:Uncharacterized protein n=1 Tax=Dichomitus squalens (strain LYAD-421) TaxID=732165 RepID=R7SYV2_DICSQ|nr:uncharacterized protein DICSQDRAFT_171367 [Dichomitus squalens LYAD-421 SS1]EJF60142.1 hypothetical protein DICSQDRAFT_171367 [Dichomitus squalens LYAD-421 SS1]
MVPKSTVLSQLAPRALLSQRRQCDPFIGLSKHHPIASLHPPCTSSGSRADRPVPVRSSHHRLCKSFAPRSSRVAAESFAPNAGSVNTSSGDAIGPHRKGAKSTQTLHIAQSSTGLGAWPAVDVVAAVLVKLDA